jgi:hypothetical protein
MAAGARGCTGGGFGAASGVGFLGLRLADNNTRHSTAAGVCGRLLGGDEGLQRGDGPGQREMAMDAPGCCGAGGMGVGAHDGLNAESSGGGGLNQKTSGHAQRQGDQAHAKSSTDAVDGVKARFTTWPQGFVQRFAGDA